MRNALTEKEVMVEEVVLKIKKSYPKRLINMIASSNTDVEVEEGDDFYILKASYLKVNRADVEALLGKLTEARWRILFINREGEVSKFNDYEFIIGSIEDVSHNNTDTIDLTQINIRIPVDLKEDMENYRSALNLKSQNEFCVMAIKELINNIKDQGV